MKENNFIEFDMLPALEIDGLILVDTISICDYIARKYEFSPENKIDKYNVDSISEFSIFVLNYISKVALNCNEEVYDKLMHEKMPYFLRKFEHRLEQNNGGFGFFVGINVSVADFLMFNIFYNYLLRPGKRERYENLVMVNAPKCSALCHRLNHSSDRFREYLYNRCNKQI